MSAYLDLPIRIGTNEAFDSLCRCDTCPLLDRRSETWCPPQRPAWFNGLYVLGEGPGANEARLKQPFIGRAGGLLDELLEGAGLRREQCFISNATSCMPPYQPPTKKQSEREARNELLRDAAQACFPRVRAEIEALQPRVILALGGVALEALTGRWIQRVKREPLFQDAQGNALPCWRCEGEMTLPYFKCGHCGEESIQFKRDAALCGVELEVEGPGWTCEHCNTVHTRVKFAARKKRCPICQGRKTKEVTYDLWRSDHRITAVNGMVFRGRHAPDHDAMEESAKVDLPCHYLIATYHPSFLLRDPGSKAEKKQAGQFLLPSSRAHFRKAARLLTEDARWCFKHRVLPDAAVAEWEAHFAFDLPSGDDPRIEPMAQAKGLEVSLTELETYLRGPAYLWSVDIETDNKDPWSVTDIRCIGFHRYGPDKHPLDEPALVVNTTQLGLEHPLVQAITSFLLDESRLKLMQHGVYDIQVLWHLWRLDCKGYRFDTMAGHNALYTDAPHDLQHIAGVYTDAPPWKPVKKVKDELVYESSAQLHAYNGRDVYNTTLAWLALQDELERARVPSGNARYVHDLDVAMFHCCRDMERAGLPVSEERWKRWEARCDFYVERAQHLAQSYIGRSDFDLSKPAQVAWALFDPYGPCRLQPLEYTDTGQPATSKTALLAYRHHPLVALTLDFRRWRDVRSRTLRGMPLMADWRIRVRWNALGARTGRFTTNPNAQNWSKIIELLVALYEGLGARNEGLGGPWPLELFPGDEVFVAKALERAKVRGGAVGAKIETPGVRELIVAPPGRKLVGADLSQAELRIVAALSGDANLIAKCLSADESRKLEPDYDPHSYVASIAFGQAYTGLDWQNSEDDKTARARLRDLIKRVIYGLFYGAGAETILEAIYDGGYEGPPISLEQIEAIISAVFTAFPDVKAWRDRQLREAERNGYVYDALIGRRRVFPGQENGRYRVDPTIAYNAQIQSSTASMMNLSLWELRNQLPSVDSTAMLIAQVHDAIYVECAEDKAEEVKHLLEGTMSQELQLVPGAPWMPFPATGKVGDSWADVG